MAHDEPESGGLPAQSAAEAPGTELVLADGPAPVIPRRIIGVGGSAGAFEAASLMLQDLYVGSGVAVILVQHLDPGHPSQLANLLARQTSLRVVEAEQGQRIEADTVYVIPAAQSMTVEGGCLRLNPRGAEVGHQWIIDAFLTSLALDVGPAAIGVLLSGTLSDGAEGLAAIHRAGGATLVQSRDSAKFPDMPEAALRLGIVDLEVPIEDMAKHLLDLSEDDVPFKRPAEATAMDQVREAVRDATGLDLRDYKLPTVTRRLQRRMDAVQAQGLPAYAKILAADPDEVQNLHDDMLIAVTQFFRDSEVFNEIAASIIPDILSRKSDGDRIRVWVPGCCTGQEAYTLAMLFNEAIQESGKRLELQVFGTDRSAPAIAIARQGSFPRDVRQEIPKELFSKYMTEEGGQARVRKSLRTQCIFAEHDLLHDPPFSSVDLVSCRNVLIYMDAPAQGRTMDAIHFGLRPDSWLILGGSEGGLRNDQRFEQVNGQQPIYRRAGGKRKLPPRLREIAMQGDPPIVLSPAKEPVGAKPRAEPSPWTGTPEALIVDDRFDVLLDLPDLHPPGQFNVLKVTQGDVADAIRRLVPAALSDGKVRRTSVDTEGGRRHLVALPIDHGSGRHVMLLFSDERISSGLLAGGRLPDLLATHMNTLNDHVASLVTAYESTLEELSCAHEEAMSANEELQSGNEELMTANEEAQSAAEELRTLNDEMRRRQAEAAAAMDDIEAVLEAEPFPLLIVDGGVVRRINGEARNMFSVSRDAGTPRMDAVEVPFRNLDLAKVIEEVSEGKGGRDLDVVHVDGSLYRINVTRAIGRTGPRHGAVVRVTPHTD